MGVAVPSARAATASVTGSTLEYTAAPGEANHVAVSASGSALTVTDTGLHVTPGPGCTAVAADRVTCTASALSVATGDMADTVVNATSAPATLSDGPGNDSVTGGSGTDVFIAGAGNDTYRGGGGADVADYSARTAAVTASLDGVANDGEVGEQDNVGTDVESIWGGSAGDRLTGGSGANELRGGDGADTLRGGGGADVLDGGAGNDDLGGDDGDDSLDGGADADTLAGGAGTDTADYSARAEPVAVSIDDPAPDGESGEGDVVGGDVERVLGGAGSDSLSGDSHANTLLGGSGDDSLDGGRGADTLAGGDGFDTADYSARSAPVSADLDGNADDGESGERDNLKQDVEAIAGGSGNDTLTGGPGPDRLLGGGGDDTLRGGGGGDLLAGGDGRDTADYSDRRNGVFVSLDGSANDGEPGEGDQVVGDVEVLKGGAAGDVLAGGDGPDTLAGGGGADLLAGRGGDDTLQGGDGQDVLQGGAGADVVEGGSGSDTLDFSDRSAPVTADLDSNSDSDGDHFGDDVENVTGGAGADRLIGGSGDGTLSGGDGDDTLDGRGGADIIIGGNGFDTADYSTRTLPVKVTLGGTSDEGGQDGEHDAVAADVEAATGGSADDVLTGSAGPNRLRGGAGNDVLVGGGGVDRFEAGAGNDFVGSRDRTSEALLCGSGRDTVNADTSDRLSSCELRGKVPAPADGSLPTPPAPGTPRTVDVHVVSRRGKFVAIPGFPGRRIDSRLLPDIRWLVAKYHIAIGDGYALSGHAAHGEHPIGLALDIVPGPGGTWKDIDRLAKFAEPHQNHPRAPWRWVGYNGDAGHGRGNHLHLSWQHAPAARGHTARWIEVLTKPRAKKK